MSTTECQCTAVNELSGDLCEPCTKEYNRTVLKRPVVKFKKLRSGAEIPKYQTAGASGMDLVFCPENDVGVLICPNGMSGVYSLATGLAMEIPPGYEAQVRPRSGLAAKYGIMVVNSPGSIDSDYRGEIKVLLTSIKHEFYISPGDRIAQLVIAPVAQAEVEEVEELGSTERGAGGFGSTGK